ncbi:uncharacterized protein LOC121778473 [Salvia splendens]|uniref:uncharacterized protein LOC121778473 n=1 Tax=Salvia splendens TaxID=180675 RepID=UPI001C2808A8|nr:uncharacterized protein LOC121778473 [Salvia splendens]
MGLDFFSYLPSELTTEILSRLSIRSLAISKSVCKPWLNLIDSDDFPKSEIKTPPALALLTPKERDSTRCTIFEIEDEDEVDDAEKSHDLHYIPLTDLVIPHGNRAFIDAITARGLLLLYSPLPKECFRIFSAPPMGYRDGDLSVLRDCLCYSYTRDNEIVIWMMKEYGVEGSWTVEFKLSTVGCDDGWDDISIDPIRHFKDGDVLMSLYRYQLIYYSNKARTIQEVGMFKDAVAGYLTALIFTPTLLSLKNFGFENVISF